VIVSGPRADFRSGKTALDVIGKVFFIARNPAGADHEAANNLLSATAVVATSEAV